MKERIWWLRNGTMIHWMLWAIMSNSFAFVNYTDVFQIVFRPFRGLVSMLVHADQHCLHTPSVSVKSLKKKTYLLNLYSLVKKRNMRNMVDWETPCWACNLLPYVHFFVDFDDNPATFSRRECLSCSALTRSARARATSRLFKFSFRKAESGRLRGVPLRLMDA